MEKTLKIILGIVVILFLIIICIFLVVKYIPAPELDLSDFCAQNGGQWDGEYKECTGISEEICKELDGSFDFCASPCTHDPNPNKPCAEYCLFVCSF